MKKILFIILCFTNLIAFSQSILVNNQSVNVSSEISFPYWLDSSSTLAIDLHVVSISVLEFNITPITNGNSLVFNQAKIITSQETVPSGKTWKVESVLLDSSFVSISNNSIGTTVVSGGGVSLRPVALSEQSSNIMNMGNAMLYCDSLVEDGYDNWVIPSLEKLMYVAGGGGVVSGIRTSDWLVTTTPIQSGIGNGPSMRGGEDEFYKVRLSDGNITNSNGVGYFRCVRDESISVSSSDSSSAGYLTPSSLGNSMPTMISNESATTMVFGNCVFYCDSLDQLGYSDWIMPTIDQLTYATSGGCVVLDTRSSFYLWTRSFDDDQDAIIYKLIPPNLSNGDDQIISRRTDNAGNFGSSFNDPKCRCVR